MNDSKDPSEIPAAGAYPPPRPPRPRLAKTSEVPPTQHADGNPVGIVLPGRPESMQFSHPPAPFTPESAEPQPPPAPSDPEPHLRRRRRSHRPKVEDYDRKHERPPASTAGGLWILAAAILLILISGLVAGAFFYGQRHAARPLAGSPTRPGVSSPGTTTEATVPPPAVPDTTVSDEVMQAISDAFGLARTGELEKAHDLFIKIQGENPAVHGLLHQIAKLEFRLHRQLEALQFIDRAVRDGETTSQALLLKGQILATQGAFPTAYVAYEQAAMADPSDPYVFFYWAEALRIEGRPRQAAAKLDEAHRRSIQQTDTFIIQIKWLLARIESDEGETLKSEIETHLADPDPSGDWLLAAAALALQENRAEDAAPLLDRARVALQPAFYNFCISDKFFDIYRGNAAVGKRLTP